MRQAESLSGGNEPVPFLLGWPALLSMLLGLTLIRLAASGSIELLADETYYRLWSLHPAWGYYDHPPMIAWWMAAGRFLVGDNALGIRLFSTLSLLVASLALWRIGCLLYDRRTAGMSVLFFNAIIVIGIGAILATPDAPSIMFWILSLWAMAELAVSRNGNWWLAVGLFAGCGLVSKYTGFFLGVGIVLWVLWCPELRHWLKSAKLWMGGAVALLVFLPVLLWNFEHDWASFGKQFGRLVPRDWTYANILEFIGQILFFVNPFLLLFLLPGAKRVIRETVFNRSPGGSLLFLTTAPFLIYLAFHAFHSEIQQNWYSPLMAAFALTAAPIAVGYGDWAMRPSRFARNWGIVTVLFGFVAVFVILLHSYTPLFENLGRRDPTSRLRGWDGIGREVESLAAEHGAKWIATTTYSYTGQFAYELRGKLPVIQLNDRIRFAMSPAPDMELLQQPALYVTLVRRDRAIELCRRFRGITRIATLDRKVGDTLLDQMHVYLLENPLKRPLGTISKPTFEHCYARHMRLKGDSQTEQPNQKRTD